MKKIRQIINVCLIGMLSIILITGCIGCSNKTETPAATKEPKAYDYYSSMTNVHQLNWTDFYSDFAYIEDKEEPKNSHWVFKICPQFIANSADYNWVYYGEDATFTYIDRNRQNYKRKGHILTLDTYMITIEPNGYFGIDKYMIYGQFRESVYFLYTFQIDWENKTTMLEGGITFCYPTEFAYNLYWKDYCAGNVSTAMEWRRGQQKAY